MAYDKSEYKALRRLGVPYKLALALADDASPVGQGGGGPVDTSELVTLATEQYVEGEKTFKKPPKVEVGSKEFLAAATIIEEYGVLQANGTLASEAYGDDLMFGWDFIVFEAGDTVKVELKVTNYGDGTTPLYVSLWSATNSPAPFQYDTQVGDYFYSTTHGVEETITVEVPDFPNDRFIIYVDGSESPSVVRQVKVWVNDQLVTYTPEVVSIPVLTGVRDLVQPIAGNDGVVELSVAEVGKVVVLRSDATSLHLLYDDSIPLGSMIEVILLEGSVEVAPQVDPAAVNAGAGQLLIANGSTEYQDGVTAAFAQVFLNKPGGRVTLIKVPSVIGSQPDDWGPTAWQMTGDYHVPDAE